MLSSLLHNSVLAFKFGCILLRNSADHFNGLGEFCEFTEDSVDQVIWEDFNDIEITLREKVRKRKIRSPFS